MIKESINPTSTLFVPDLEFTTCYLENLLASDPSNLTDFDLYQAISFMFRSNHPTPFMNNGEVRLFDGIGWIALGCDSPFRRKPYYLGWMVRIGSPDTFEFRVRGDKVKTYITDYRDIPEVSEPVFHTATSRQKMINDLLHGQLIGAVRVVA